MKELTAQAAQVTWQMFELLRYVRPVRGAEEGCFGALELGTGNMTVELGSHWRVIPKIMSECDRRNSEAAYSSIHEWPPV